jgi:uncharacterized protein YlxW (UPF0749 family)
MLLLNSLVEESLDEGYARAAARRAAGEPPHRYGPVMLVAGLAAVGLLLATAAAQTRERSSATAEARDALTAEIEDRTGTNDRLERQLDRQRAQVAKAVSDQLRITAEGARVSRQLTTLEAATGAGPVEGAGFVIRLTDDPVDPDGADVDPRTDTSADEGRVSDRDLQTVVNEVWAAGAEAVAVNGQRLTALSAIRSAGDAVLVDFRPISPPYEVSAIGPPEMRSTFVDGFGGSYLQVLRDYGIDYTVQDDADLQLGASAGVAIRYAVSPSDVASGGTGTRRPDGERTSEGTR